MYGDQTPNAPLGGMIQQPQQLGGMPQQLGSVMGGMGQSQPPQQSGFGPYPGGWNAGQNPSMPGQGGFGPYPGGWNASPGGPLAGPGQMPPRQAPGGPLPPMGAPMTDPNSAGGFFGHPNYGGMPRPGFRQ